MKHKSLEKHLNYMAQAPIQWIYCEQSLKKEYGIDWAKGYLGKLLENHFYYGTMIIKGKRYPHRYPPAITQALFDQVQHIKKVLTNTQLNLLENHISTAALFVVAIVVWQSRLKNIRDTSIIIAPNIKVNIMLIGFAKKPLLKK
jgi:Recombinase